MAGLARRTLATLTTFVLLAAVGFSLGALAGILWEQPRLVLSYLTGGTTEIAWGSDDQAPLPDVAAASETLGPVAMSEAAAVASTASEGAASYPSAPAAKESAREPEREPGARPASESAGKTADTADATPKAAPEPPAKPVTSPKPATGAEPANPAAPAAPPPAHGPDARLSVQVGAFGDREAAEGLAERLQGSGYSAYVTPGASGGTARWRVRVGPVASRAGAEGLASRLKNNEKLPTWILDEVND